MDKKLFETRCYNLKRGMGNKFHELMHSQSVPLHKQFNIDVIKYGQSLDNPDVYYLVRAFKNEEDLKNTLNNFYNSSEWKDGPRKGIISSISSDICFINWE